MKKILFTLAAMTVLSVAFASPALAAPRSGHVPLPEMFAVLAA